MNSFGILVGCAGGAAMTMPWIILKKWILIKREIPDKAILGIRLAGLLIVLACAGGILGGFAGVSWKLLYLLFLLLDCSLIAVIDWEYSIIPNGLILALFPLTLFFASTRTIEFHIWSSAIGLVLCFILFLFPKIFGKNVGAGDVKLAAAMGFCTGWIGCLYASVVMGALILLFTMFQRNVPFAQRFQKLIPMGPFIAAALLVVQSVIV
ncbi:MAG: A24 family peptidase [Clostridiaceae bacterium]|nr:A24 family peptidase [Clostridiaceae bacterium]